MSLDELVASRLLLRERRPAILIIVTAVLFLGTNAPAQSVDDSDRSTSVVGRGVVVETITKNSEADKAGIRKGDILLRWSRGDLKSSIESPFELPYIRFEQASRGPVKISGLRGDRQRSWRLGSDVWGIASRPNFTEPLLSMYRKGQALMNAGKPIEAAGRWRAGASLAQNYDIPWLRPWLLSRAAQVLFDAAQWEEADNAYREATQAIPDPGPITKAELFRQWAAGFNYRDDLCNAEKYYNEVLLEWQHLGTGPMATSNAFLQLADVDLQLGELDNAEKHLSQASNLAEKLGPASYQATLILADFGVLLEERGELDRAEEYYLKALAREQRYFPSSMHLAHTLAALGTLAHQRSDFARAETYYRRALVIATKLDRESLDVAQILSDLSECILEEKNLRHAETYEKKALSIRKKNAPSGLDATFSLARLGKIARLRGDLSVAEAYYQEALASAAKIVVPERQRARLLIGEADVLRDRQDFGKAEDLYRQALAVIEPIAPQSIDRGEILAALADTLRREQKLEAAAQLYKQALDLFEKKSVHLTQVAEQRSLYRSHESRYYHEYADVLLQQGELGNAFEVWEGSRAHTLVEMLARANVDLSGSADPELVGRGRKLWQLLQAKSEYRLRLVNSPNAEIKMPTLDAEIEQLMFEYQQVQEQLDLSSSSYTTLKQPQTLSVAEIQRLLDANTLLLEYSLGEDRSYVWAVSEKSITAYELPKRKEIEKTARLVYSLVTRRNQGTGPQGEADRLRSEREYRIAAQRLTGMVLGPVAALLEDKRLLIVSDGALQYVPFAALPEPKGHPTGLPLVVNHEIVNLPSASVLAELRQHRVDRPTPARMVAVLADPVFDPKDERLRAANEKPESSTKLLVSDLTRSANDVGLTQNGRFYLNRLLYTRNEADAVMAVTPPGKGMEILDFRATREMALSGTLANYRIVHFATHGILNNKHPELSGLVLSLVNKNGKAQDGFLKLQDIYNLKLPVDLVVLSGCQTGLGEEIEGEGLIGLTRGFMYAGASRVVASLWNVSDMATAKLMADFYSAMEHDNVRPAAALRNAQVRMWSTKQWSAPYYWAAFQIQGEWQ